LFYTVNTFILSYGTGTLEVSRTAMLVAAMIAVFLMGGLTLYFAVRSDRIGRKRLCMGSAVLATLWAFPLFWLVNTRNPVLITIGMIGGMVCFAMLYGPMGAFLPDCSGCDTATRVLPSPTAPVAL
jgi:MFS family permease